MNKNIIINGRAGAGKDIVADYLVNYYGYTKIAFADEIYSIAYNLFNMNKKDRKLLQAIGQNLREIDPNVWVNSTLGKVEKLDRVVISDCRQSNEYDLAVAKGFVPIRVNADEMKRFERLKQRDKSIPEMELLEKEEEIGADDKEYIEIYNNGTIKELYEQIDRVMIEQ